MTLTSEERKHQSSRKERQGFNGRDILSKIFNNTQNTPPPRVLQVGLIDSGITYELARGNVTDTERDYYTVRIAAHRHDTKSEDLLMSGVFATRHDAQSYIDYLKAKNGPI
jgi:hypothetical protein